MLPGGEMEKRRVVITGMGVIAPNGIGIDKLLGFTGSRKIRR